MINTKLRELRTERGLKQSDVASVIGCAPTTITNWETGKNFPPLDMLQKLCDVYKVTPLSLLDEVPTVGGIAQAMLKPYYERTYEEQIMVNFDKTIPEVRALLHADSERIMNEIEEWKRFDEIARIQDRFDSTTREQRDKLRTLYQENAELLSDLAFAFLVLSPLDKEMILRLFDVALFQHADVADLGTGTEKAIKYTGDRIHDQLKNFKK